MAPHGIDASRVVTVLNIELHAHSIEKRCAFSGLQRQFHTVGDLAGTVALFW